MTKYLKIIVSILVLIIIQAETFFIDPAENAVDHNNLGLFYLKVEDYAAAIQEFKIAIALSPNAASTASFYNNLGEVYLRLHLYNWAISCFNISISKSPNFLEYYSNLVKTYKANKNLGTLANKYKKQIKNSKSDYITWLMIGLIFKEQNNNIEAIKSFKEFKKHGPDELLEKAVDNMVFNMQ